MLTVLSAFLVLFALTAAQQQMQQRPSYTHHASLDPNGKFMVHWLPAANDSDYVIFECEVATQGWLGLGFSPNGAMAGADMVIAWVDASGRPQISDRHGPARGNGYPPADDSQSYELLSGRKNRTHTVVTFRRRQDTCDPQDWKITSDTTRMIWAYHDQLPTSADNIAMHTQRGAHSEHLINIQSKDGMNKIVTDPNTKTYDLRVAKVNLPNNKRTLYWCEVIELPKWKKHHVIATSMVVQKGNERYVHHAAVYGCGQKDMSKYLGKPTACFDDTHVADPMIMCSDIMNVWAIGGEDFVYPSNMGMPFFEDPNQRYIMLEMHYDNPDLLPGLTDTSAFRMYMTENFRPIETGRMTVTMPVNSVELIIPPKQQKFTTYAYVPSECTSRMTKPMNVFTGLLHTHLLGVAMKLRVIRKGTEIKSEMRDDHYDFNYQTPVYLSQPLVIMPGDELIFECTYDSTNRDTMAFGGFGTNEEMCMTLMEYYPKRNKTSEFVLSFVDPKEMVKILGLSGQPIDFGTDGVFGSSFVTLIDKNQRNVSIADWYKNDLKITDDMVKRLQDFMKNSPQEVMCGLEGRDKKGNFADMVTMKLNGPIQVARPYVEPPSVCMAPSGSSAFGAAQSTRTTNNRG